MMRDMVHCRQSHCEELTTAFYILFYYEMTSLGMSSRESNERSRQQHFIILITRARVGLDFQVWLLFDFN